MNENLNQGQRWNTSSFANSPVTSPIELANLGEHLSRCHRQRGSFFALKCMGDSLREFLAPRVMTILVVFAMVSVLASVVR
jgi:hypothetical protein